MESNMSKGNGTADAAMEISSNWVSPLEEKPVATVIYLIILGGMTVMGTVGNAMIVGATLVVQSLRTPGNIFIVNMALSDLVLSAIVNPFAIIGTLYGKPWFEGDKWHVCVFIGSACLVTCGCSLLSILTIAFNRYIALVHHAYYLTIFTWRNVGFMVAGIWFVAFTLVIPLHGGWTDHGFDEKGMMCIFDRKASYSFNLVLMFVIVLVPIIMIAYFYSKIFLHIRERKKKLRSVNKTAGNDHKEDKVARDERRLAKTLFIIFMGFFICWIPFSIVCIFDFPDDWPKDIYLFTYTIDHFSSSGLNFVLYGVTNQNFRKGYVKVLGYLGCGCCERVVDGANTGKASAVASKGGVNRVAVLPVSRNS